jgi:Two component regulator propeller
VLRLQIHSMRKCRYRLYKMKGKINRSAGLFLNSDIHCIFSDKDGGLWIGTDKGINFLTQLYRYFHSKIILCIGNLCIFEKNIQFLQFELVNDI